MILYNIYIYIYIYREREREIHEFMSVLSQTLVSHPRTKFQIEGVTSQIPNNTNNNDNNVTYYHIMVCYDIVNYKLS